MYRNNTSYIIRITVLSIALHILIHITTGFQSLRFITLLFGNGNLCSTTGNGCRSSNGSQCRPNNRDTGHSLVCLHSGNRSTGSHLKDRGGKLFVGILLFNLVDGFFLLLLKLRGIFTGFLGCLNLFIIFSGNFADLRILQSTYHLTGSRCGLTNDVECRPRHIFP